MIEDVINNIHSMLDTYLEAEIDRQNDKYADAVKAEVPAYIYKSERFDLEGMPALVILPDYRETEELLQSGYKYVIHHLQIIAVINDTDAWKLRQKLYRTTRAIETVLETKFQSISGSVIGDIDVERIQWDGVEGYDSGFVLGGTVFFSAREKIQAYTENQT